MHLVGTAFRAATSSTLLWVQPHPSALSSMSRRPLPLPPFRVILANMMSNSSSLSLHELEKRISFVRENIRHLIEQAAAASGRQDEVRNADRIAQQTEELERLIKQRDALLKK
jgi:uncharacterized small protein (DUF1192 family)